MSAGRITAHVTGVQSTGEAARRVLAGLPAEVRDLVLADLGRYVDARVTTHGGQLAVVVQLDEHGLRQRAEDLAAVHDMRDFFERLAAAAVRDDADPFDDGADDGREHL